MQRLPNFVDVFRNPLSKGFSNQTGVIIVKPSELHILKGHAQEAPGFRYFIEQLHILLTIAGFWRCVLCSAIPAVPLLMKLQHSDTVGL